jgi:NAD(P)-dependent dehydrogenase (short-subunit alcohol dehydrogenase family)
MTGMCEGRAIIVTGAGRGIGREEALELARQGADVVVNDLGVSKDTMEGSSTPAEEVAAEIRALGGRALANGDDVSDWDGAGRLVAQAVEAFGRLDGLVNNAGILRDRMLVNMSVDEWDAVIRVHMRGTFCPTRHAADYWRAQSKEGQAVDARIVNTSSPTGLYGNVGQANYGAAKGGMATFSMIVADELSRYGVGVNCIAPSALTRMTETLDAYVEANRAAEEATGFNPGDPANIAPLVAWLSGSGSQGITGRVFNVRGGHISVAEGWAAGPGADRDGRWTTEELDDIVPKLVAEARPRSDGRGRPRVPDGSNA